MSTVARKSGVLHRIHFLDVKVEKIHTLILKKGKEVCGDSFHMSWPVVLRLRPFQVRTAGREVSAPIGSWPAYL